MIAQLKMSEKEIKKICRKINILISRQATTNKPRLQPLAAPPSHQTTEREAFCQKAFSQPSLAENFPSGKL